MGFLVSPIKDFKNGRRRKLNATLLEFKEGNCGAGKLSISAAALTKTMEHRKRGSHRHGGAASNHLAKGTNRKGPKYQRRCASTLASSEKKETKRRVRGMPFHPGQCSERGSTSQSLLAMLQLLPKTAML